MTHADHLLALIEWTRKTLGIAIDMRPGEQRDGALRAIQRALTASDEGNPRLVRLVRSGTRRRCMTIVTHCLALIFGILIGFVLADILPGNREGD